MGKLISEASVAGLTGLSRERLRSMRGELVRGEHWQHAKNGEVVFTQEGVTAIMGMISERVQFGAVDPVNEPPKEAAASDLVMWFPCLSRYWVKAKMDGRLVRCRVRDNTNLRRGMILRGCVKQEGDVWSFGGRCG